MNRLWNSPTLMLVFSTSPPINRFWIERLTVTLELVASRLAVSDCDRQAVDRDVIHAQPERDVPRAGRGDQEDVVGLAADVEVADLGVELAFRRGHVERIFGHEGREVGRVAADPHVADLAGGGAALRDHERAARRRTGWGSSGSANCEGTSPAVVLPVIVLAWNRFNRPVTRKVA